MWFLNLKSPAEDEVKAQMGNPSQLGAHTFAFPPVTVTKGKSAPEVCSV